MLATFQEDFEKLIKERVKKGVYLFVNVLCHAAHIVRLMIIELDTYRLVLY